MHKTFITIPTQYTHNHRQPSFSGRQFPTVEHSAADDHVGAVTDYFLETPEDSSLQSFRLQCSTRSVTSPFHTLWSIFFTYLLTYTHIHKLYTFCSRKLQVVNMRRPCTIRDLLTLRLSRTAVIGVDAIVPASMYSLWCVRRDIILTSEWEGWTVGVDYGVRSIGGISLVHGLIFVNKQRE